MNARLSVLLMASLLGLAVSAPALAGPGLLDAVFADSGLLIRDDRDHGKQEEREARKTGKQSDKKSGRKAKDEEEHERGYGYGYERRSSQPLHDDRGRR